MYELKNTTYLEKDLKTMRAHNTLMMNSKEEICIGEEEGTAKLFPFSSTNPLGGLCSGFSYLLISYYILKYWLFFLLLSLQIHYIF